MPIEVVTGRKKLIDDAHKNNNPHSDTIGRGMKVGKEEIMGLLDKSAVTFQVMMTKTDKVSKAELPKSLEITRASLAKHPAAFPEIVLTSSEKSDGIETLRAIIATID